MILLNNINVTFKQSQILKNVSLSFEEGQIYGLLGRNVWAPWKKWTR